MYTCPQGFRFSVKTRGDSAVVRTPPRTLTLPHVGAASGEKYQADDAVLRRNGNEARLETAEGKYDSCGGTPAETPWEEARLLGIEFRAVGQEPAWMLEIDQGHSITYTGDYGKTQLIAPDRGSSPYSNPGTGIRHYGAQSEARAWSVLVTPAHCTDTMSDETFPYKVTVRFDRHWVDGCGRTLETGDLIGVYWKLVELDSGPVTELDPYGRGLFSIFPAFEPHLRITDQGHAVTGGTGCTDFSGRAEVAGERMRMGPLTTRPFMLISARPAMRIGDSMTKAIVDTTTKSPCGPELLGQEQRFLRALESADRLEARTDSLTLYAGAQPVSRFQALYLR